MTRKSAAVWFAALLTLGSGILNCLSVIYPAVPERHALLRDAFPLVFLHISRLAALIAGFALIISALNIFRRKRRAFHAVILLSAASAAFHLAKGLDFEAAAVSLILIGILWVERGQFTVRSGIIGIRGIFVRMIFSAAVAFLYGVMGFWLLDAKEFGINFTLADAFSRTMKFFSLAGDPGIVPHTHHARWFIDSLYAIGASFVAYSLFLLFRPVVHRYHTLPLERSVAASITSRYGRSSLDFFKYWTDKSFLFSRNRESFIAYRVSGRYALALGDPVGPENEMEMIIREFSAICRDNDWTPAFHQTLPDFMPLYRHLGFRKLKIGDDAIVELSEAHLRELWSKLDRVLRRMEKGGFHIQEFEPPVSDDVLFRLKDVSDEWLHIQGRRERGFTLGLFDPDYIHKTPVLTVADDKGDFHAFVNIIPSFRKGETTIDLMRRRETVPNGIMDYLFLRLFEYSKKNGFSRFNLGMAPMAGFREREEATAEERAVHFFFQHLNFLFSYRGLRFYKAKFATSWEPRYLIYRNPLDLPGLVAALNTVSTIPGVKETETTFGGVPV